MNFDLGTLSGVLGVILTIVFFVVGYRQTIGARKERASAANREILETLLRRLTLEPDFSLTREGIERFICGRVIESKVKRSDATTIDQLWDLLYSRIIGVDYVSAKQRRLMLEKIDICFDRSRSENRDELVLKHVVDGKESRDDRQFVYLGIMSSIMAGALVAVGARIFTEWSDQIASNIPILASLILSILTATVLVLFFWVREKSSVDKVDLQHSTSRSREFEKLIEQRLEAIGIPVDYSHPDVDFVIQLRGQRVAVELKSYAPSIRNISAVIKRLATALSQLKCDKGYIVTGSPIPPRIRALTTDTIKIMDAKEFLRLVTEPAPLRTAANSTD